MGDAGLEGIQVGVRLGIISGRHFGRPPRATLLQPSRVHFTLVHLYDFITGKRADIRRGDSWGWGFFHERLIRPYIYVDETIGVGNKKQTRPIVVRCPQWRSL